MRTSHLDSPLRHATFVECKFPEKKQCQPFSSKNTIFCRIDFNTCVITVHRSSIDRCRLFHNCHVNYRYINQSVLSRSAIVVLSKFLVAFLCCPLVFEVSVGIGFFVIGLSQISFFFSLEVKQIS